MLLIGITGGSGSGKTTVVRKVMDSFSREQVTILSQDNYYKDNSHISPEARRNINFDHPDSIEFDLLVQHLEQLHAGRAIEEPTYDYITSTRQQQTIRVEPKHVIIVEGILLFTDQRVRDLCDMKVFVDAEPDDRLIRIIERDMRERGRTAHQSARQRFRAIVGDDPQITGISIQHHPQGRRIVVIKAQQHAVKKFDRLSDGRLAQIERHDLDQFLDQCRFGLTRL